MQNDSLPKKSSYAKSNGQRDVRAIVDEVKDNVQELKERALDVKTKVMDRSGSAVDKIRNFATANPFKAVAIAFAVGFFAMRVTRPLRFL